MSQKLENAKGLYLEGIRDGKAREAVTKYTGDRYIQHSTGIRDGIEGFVEFFEPFIERNPKRDIQIIRGLEDGQYVFLHICDVLIGENPHNIDKYISSETFIQHNTDVPDGLENFKSLALAEERPLLYQEIVLLVGQGNFVATLCRATWEGVPYAQVDLFRIEDGLVVEHWDNAEVVPPESEWANSGKF